MKKLLFLLLLMVLVSCDKDKGEGCSDPPPPREDPHDMYTRETVTHEMGTETFIVYGYVCTVDSISATYIFRRMEPCGEWDMTFDERRCIPGWQPPENEK